MNRPGCFLNSCKCSASTASCSEEFHCFIMPEPFPWACFEPDTPLFHCSSPFLSWKKWSSQTHLPSAMGAEEMASFCPIWEHNSIALNYLIKSKCNSAQQIEKYSSFCRATCFVTQRMCFNSAFVDCSSPSRLAT